MCVRAFVERERATVDKLYASLPDPTWEGTLDLFGSGLLCPCKLNFMCVCVCVCVYTSQFRHNKLYIYLYDLYSPVASFFLYVCVCVCVYMCVRAFVE